MDLPSSSRREEQGDQEYVTANLSHSDTNSVVNSEGLQQPILGRDGSGGLGLDTRTRSVNVYPMNAKYRGKVVIFNQETFENERFSDRLGTTKDVERLFEVLPRLGFRKRDIIVYKDAKKKDIRKICRKLRKDVLDNYDCLLVVILTHGDGDDLLMAKDESYHFYEFMVPMFTPNKLKSMASKPKLFLIQSCRGTAGDLGVQRTEKGLAKTNGVQDEIDSRIPKYIDFMFMMSSCEGVKYDGSTELGFLERNTTHGSWYIQELCNVIERCDLDGDDICDIITETQSAIATRNSNINEGKQQTPIFECKLSKKLFFKPKKRSPQTQPTQINRS